MSKEPDPDLRPARTGSVGRGGVWLRCGVLLDGASPGCQRDMAIHVVGDRIDDVRPAGDIMRAGEAPLDYSRYTVCPGYIDSHVHLTFNHGPDHESIRALVESSGPDQLALLAARAATDCLLAGVTTVRDCGDRDFVTLGLRHAIALGTLPGPRILASGPPITVTAGHLHWCGGAADSPDELRRRTRELCSRGVDWVKVMASGGNMTAESDALNPQFTSGELRMVVTEAHRLDRRVAAHASNTESIRRSVEAGVDTVEHCLWRSPSGEHEYDAAVVDTMVQRGVWTDLTLAGISRVLLEDHDGDGGQEQRNGASADPTENLHDQYEWARTMRRRGALMMLSSDAGVRFTPFRRFDETLRCGIEALDISFGEAVTLATSCAAKAIGIGGQVGTISPGYYADVLVLEGLVTDASKRVPPVREVWRNGRVVVRDGYLRAETDR